MRCRDSAERNIKQLPVFNDGLYLKGVFKNILLCGFSGRLIFILF